MATWSEYFFGTSKTNGEQQPPPGAPPGAPPNIVVTGNPPEIEKDLPEYSTFNSLSPEFQLTDDLDPDYIFPREYELIGEVKKQVPAVAHWPDRYVLIFLFARRHSIPHTVKLLNKHVAYIESMGFQPYSEDNLYPFTPEQLTDEEFKLSLLEGPLAYKHIMIDKHQRILQIVRPRCWVYGRLSVKRYISFVLWWYYYTFQHVPLKYHRNGIAVIVDMTNMGWSNLDFSSEVQHFITNALTCFPGRMRQAWLINSGWILSSCLSLLSYVLSAKIMSRMQPVSIDTLLGKVDKVHLPTDLGGNWVPDFKKDWFDKVKELDEAKKNSKKN